MSNSLYAQYLGGQLFEVPKEDPDSFRQGLYVYARRHGLKARAYIRWDSLPHPVVVFRIGEEELEDLPDAPPRGKNSHRKNKDS